jgi:hypothetical protein
MMAFGRHENRGLGAGVDDGAGEVEGIDNVSGVGESDGRWGVSGGSVGWWTVASDGGSGRLRLATTAWIRGTASTEALV